VDNMANHAEKLKNSKYIITILTVQILGIVFIAYHFAWSEVANPWIDFGLLAIGITSITSITLIPVGIIGIIIGLREFSRSTRRLKLYLLLSLSFISIMPPFSIFVGDILHPILIPVAEIVYKSQFVWERSVNDNIERTHYTILTEEFMVPQKISEVYDNTSLRLESERVVFVDSIFRGPRWEQKKFIEYVQKHLIDKEVNIQLEEFSTFQSQYTSKVVFLSDGKFRPMYDPKLNEMYGAIPVLIYNKDGVSVNEEYNK